MTNMAFLLHKLLIESTLNFPNKEAVLFGDESLTYRDLNENSDKLAKLLIDHGIKRGDRVGIYLEKGLDSIVGIFGILKSGACYVPLDP